MWRCQGRSLLLTVADVPWPHGFVRDTVVALVGRGCLAWSRTTVSTADDATHGPISFVHDAVVALGWGWIL